MSESTVSQRIDNVNEPDDRIAHHTTGNHIVDQTNVEDVQNRRRTTTSEGAMPSTGIETDSAVSFLSAQTQPSTTTSSSQSSSTARTHGRHSPSPYWVGPTEIQGPHSRTELLSPLQRNSEMLRPNTTAGYPRSNVSDPLPRTRAPRASIAPTIVGDSGSTHLPTPTMRVPQFTSLEGLIPSDRLEHLRVLGVQYGLQAGKLRIVSDHLGALSSQTADIREQATSAIDRGQQPLHVGRRTLPIRNGGHI